MNVKVKLTETDLGFTPEMDKTTVVYGKVEKAEWQAFIIDELAKRGQLKPEFAESEDWLNDPANNADTTKFYATPDNRIFAYMHTEKVVGGSTNRANKSTTLDEDGDKVADWQVGYWHR